MKLNTKSKNELRKKIIEQLEKVPDGQRVQLDKDILNNLLFETVTIDKEKNIQVKLPVWSGTFLKKIDLSQVDFTNVSWFILCSNAYDEYDIYDIGFDSSAYEIIEKILSDNLYTIDYSGTNANIDLTKSFEAKYGDGVISVRDCNFSGIDFSHVNLDEFTKLDLVRTNIGETNLVIPSKIDLEACGSCFKGINLSSRTIDAHDNYFTGDCTDDRNILLNCDLRDTGICINLNPEQFKDTKWQTKLQIAINENWTGCYVNGKKVNSDKEKANYAQEKREEYEKMKEEIFHPVLQSIEEQTNHMKR